MMLKFEVDAKSLKDGFYFVGTGEDAVVAATYLVHRLFLVLSSYPPVAEEFKKRVLTILQEDSSPVWDTALEERK